MDEVNGQCDYLVVNKTNNLFYSWRGLENRGQVWFVSNMDMCQNKKTSAYNWPLELRENSVFVKGQALVRVWTVLGLNYFWGSFLLKVFTYLLDILLLFLHCHLYTGIFRPWKSFLHHVQTLKVTALRIVLFHYHQALQLLDPMFPLLTKRWVKSFTKQQFYKLTDCLMTGKIFQNHWSSYTESFSAQNFVCTGNIQVSECQVWT